MVTLGGEGGTVPELLFEKKGLIPALQQLLVSYSTYQGVPLRRLREAAWQQYHQPG
jgi:hypothetical protein